MACLARARSARAASSRFEYLSAMKPGSRVVGGGFGASARRSVAASAPGASADAADRSRPAVSSPCGKPAEAASLLASTAARFSPSRTAARSPGPALPSDRRPHARSTSGMPPSASRQSARRLGSSTKRRTIASRRSMVRGSVSGADSCRTRSLAPGAVTVRSMTDSSDPSRPEAEVSTSKPRSVGPSISMVSPAAARRGMTRPAGRCPTTLRT